MNIREIQIGDLVDSSLHKSWCLVVKTTHEPNLFSRGSKNIGPAHEGRCRIDILNLANKKVYTLTFPDNVALEILNKFKFYRNGERLS